mgnify:CR=1 FL=1
MDLIVQKDNPQKFEGFCFQIQKCFGKIGGYCFIKGKERDSGEDKMKLQKHLLQNKYFQKYK